MSTQKYKISVIETRSDADARFMICPTNNVSGWNIFEHDPFVNEDGLLAGVVQTTYPYSVMIGQGKNTEFTLMRKLGLSLDEIHACKDSRIHGPYQMMSVNPNPTPGGNHVPKYDEPIKVLIVEWFDHE